MRSRWALVTAVLAVAAVPALHAAPTGQAKSRGIDVVFEAMRDEMQRSLDDLRLGDEPRPYFLSYRVDDLEISEVGATFGGPLRNSTSRDRVLSADVRVGSPARDNTNFFSFGDGSSGITRSWNGSIRVPLEDRYREIRRQAWLLTDAAYKTALENLARKSAELENRRVPGDLPDFTPTEPAIVEEILEAEAFDRSRAEALVSAVSRVFRSQPAVHHSVARVRLVIQHSRYVNSEGSSFERSVPQLELVVAASTQADDGTPLGEAVAYYGHSLADLPAIERLESEATEMGQRLAAAMTGEEIERYNGPVLFTGQAAGELFHQVFASRLAGWRPPIAEDERLEKRLAQLGESLNDRIGGRVLARSMRLVDDPLTTEIEGVRLSGGYLVDDEGVPATATTLVDRGILKSLLSGRNPSRGVEASTGNRRGVSALPSNLLLSTSDGKSREELLQELMQLVEERDLEFGVIVRRLANPSLLAGLEPGRSAGPGGNDDAVTGVVEAVKIYRDGRQVLLRDPRFAGLSAISFRDIVAASSTREVYSAPMRSAQGGIALYSSATLGSALAGPPVVSVVVPDLLFEELTITAPVESVPTAPATSHPFFED